MVTGLPAPHSVASTQFPQRPDHAWMLVGVDLFNLPIATLLACIVHEGLIRYVWQLVGVDLFHFCEQC